MSEETRNPEARPESSARKGLSRRRFFGAASLAAAAVANSTAFGQERRQRRSNAAKAPIETLSALTSNLADRCANTRLLFGAYTFRNLFSRLQPQRISFADMVEAGMGNFSGNPLIHGRLGTLVTRLREIEAARSTALHVRHLYVDTPEVWSNNNSTVVTNLLQAFLDLDADFLIAPYYHITNPRVDNTKMAYFLDGWQESQADGTRVNARGFVDIFGQIEVQAFDALNADPPEARRWWDHLLRRAFDYGLIAPGGIYRLSAPISTKGNVEIMSTPNECAVWDGANWQCVYEEGLKCSIDPATHLPHDVGCDICPP